MSIKQFKEDWSYVREKTIEFLESIPKYKISWRPNENLGTVGMQIRHLCVSQKAYIDGIKKGKIDFSDKSFDKELETNLEKGINYLKDLDKELFKLLEKESLDKEIEFIDGIEGTSKITLKRVLDYLIDHEIYHQGIFTCYGRLLNLGKFRFM